MAAENLPPNYPQQGIIRKRLEYEMPKLPSQRQQGGAVTMQST
jgi:hypothetical protein